MIEPAKASEVAPLIVDAYELTPREVDVTRALARGLSTNEIARELHLSRYTVQDHLKSVYEKTGVSSRGELVAKVFADHYFDRLRGAIHWEGGFVAAEAEHRERDQGGGGTESEGDAGDEADLGVDRFDQRVGEAVLERGVDP